MSTSEPARPWVIIDDTNSRIRYTNPSQWSLFGNSNEAAGGLGDTIFNGTYHSSQSNSAQFTFTFNGTAFQMGGRVGSEEGEPQWDCRIDSNLIDPPLFNETKGADVFLCFADGLEAKEHTFEFTLTSDTRIDFDNVQYETLPDDPLEDVTLYVAAADPNSGILFSSGWQDFDYEDDNQTDTKYALDGGASFKYKFNGTAVTMVGVMQAGVDSSATYTLDGGSPVTFDIPGYGADSNEPVKYNQALFVVTGLSGDQEHDLEVKASTGYIDASGPVPLELLALYITLPGGPEVDVTTAASGDSNSSSSGKSLPIGAIVGGAVGGVALIVLIIIAFFFLRRRNRRRQGTQPLDLSGGLYENEPFVAPGPGSAGTMSTAPSSTAGLLPPSHGPQMTQMAPPSVPVDAGLNARILAWNAQAEQAPAPSAYSHSPPASQAPSSVYAPSTSVGAWTVANGSDHQGPSQAVYGHGAAVVNGNAGMNASHISEKEQLRLRFEQQQQQQEEEAPPPAYYSDRAGPSVSGS